MDDVEGVPKSLILWSVVLLVGLFLFSLISFFLLRVRERRLARERVVFVDWDGVASVAWAVTCGAIVLVATLTYARLHGHRWWSKSDRIEAYQEGGHEYAERAEHRFRAVRDVVWHVGVPVAAVVCVHTWSWASGRRALRRYRGPAKHSGWLLMPIALTAGLLLVIGVSYRRAFWTPVHPHFDTSGICSKRVAGPLVFDLRDYRAADSTRHTCCVKVKKRDCEPYRDQAFRISRQRSLIGNPVLRSIAGSWRAM